jgi:uncharacterized protein (TIGR02246 family)
MTTDRWAITEVLARYCQACDDGVFEDLLDLFTADGTFAYGGQVISGRAALAEYFARVQTPDRRGKHVTANVVVSLDGDRAAVSSDWVFLAYVDGVLTPKLTGRYDDLLRREDGAWLLAERVVTPMTNPG